MQSNSMENCQYMIFFPLQELRADESFVEIS